MNPREVPADENVLIFPSIAFPTSKNRSHHAATIAIGRVQANG
ncbi:hypothetical protein [Thauera aromatica]|nr:hypothetical protein [Thauera aromatica]